MCYDIHTIMRNPISQDSNLRQRFLHQFEKLWPAIKGSLAEVRKPCIRPHCPACARGDKHRAFILSFTDKGRRRCMYVPAELVPQLRRPFAKARTWKPCPTNRGRNSCVSTPRDEAPPPPN